MTDIPNPVETGSDGTQKTGIENITIPETVSPLHGLPMIKTLEGLTANKSRGLGGEIVANLLTGSFSQLSHDLQETKKDLQSTRKELSYVQQELSSCKERAAMLQERVNNFTQDRHLRNICISAGTILIGLGIEFLSKIGDSSYIIMVLGAALILFGWFFRNGDAAK